jgi:hypothetical protein
MKQALFHFEKVFASVTHKKHNKPHEMKELPIWHPYCKHLRHRRLRYYQN